MKIRDKLRFLWRGLRYRYILDPGEIKAIISRIGAGDLVVDIGAHKGAYAYWMQQRVGPKGKLVCFEPQPILAAYLDAAISAFAWQHVCVVANGVSSAPGELILYVPAGTSTSPGASLEKGKDADGASQTTVEVTTLDQYFGSKRDKPVKLIKCDVEGHELEVFKGARSILEEDKPVLLFECEGRHRSGGIDEVFEYLLSLDYEGFFIEGQQERPLAEFKEKQHQLPGQKPYLNNFLFLPKNRD